MPWPGVGQEWARTGQDAISSRWVDREVAARSLNHFLLTQDRRGQVKIKDNFPRNVEGVKRFFSIFSYLCANQSKRHKWIRAGGNGTATEHGHLNELCMGNGKGARQMKWAKAIN